MSEIEKKIQKIKHLEFIQDVINRMASNSLFIKGMCITLVSAIFVMADKDTNIMFVSIAYISILTFWIIDGYYLFQERLFRSLYDDIRLREETDFSMDIGAYKGGRNGWIESISSSTIVIFYGSLVIITVIIIYIKYFISY